MTLTIDLTPEEETRLRVAAKRQGMEPAACARNLLSQCLPPVDTATAEFEANAASIALLKSWLSQDDSSDPDEIRHAQDELDQFKQAINAERDRAGARRVYP